MMRFATQEERDDARREWFETSELRRKEKEAKEAKRKQDEVFWREWWDKDTGTAKVVQDARDLGVGGKKK